MNYTIPPQVDSKANSSLTTPKMEAKGVSGQNGASEGSNHGRFVANTDDFRLMREIIGKEDPAAMIVDDPTLRRFLYARECNVQKACELYLKYRKWRQSFVPLGYISEAMIPNELQKNLLSMQGYDKKGRPIAVLHLTRHKPCPRTLEDLKRLLVYSLDKLCSSASRGEEQVCIIADFDGWTYKHADIHGCLAVLDIMQNYYPERLGKLFVIRMPYIFWAAWNIVYPFIDKRTRQKVLLIDNKDIKTILSKDIDESQLPYIYGGKLPLVPIQDAVVPNQAPN